MIATSWIRSCPRSSRSATIAVFQSTQAIFRITLKRSMRPATDCFALVQDWQPATANPAPAQNTVIVLVSSASANFGNPNIFANIARYAIIGFAALIALEQLQIAPALLNILFTAIVGAAAIAFGLAFGLGGQDAARRWLARTEGTVASAASQIQAQQSVSQARAQQMNDAYQQPQYNQAAQQPFNQPAQQPYNQPATQPYDQSATQPYTDQPAAYNQATQPPRKRPPTR